MKIDVKSELKPYTDFKHTFILWETGQWSAIENESGLADGKLGVPVVEDPDLKDEFEEYKRTRPEYVYKVFKHIAIHGGSVHLDDQREFVDMTNKDIFENLLAFSMIAGAEDQQKAWKQAMRLISWLRGTNFYESPASTIYHEAFEGGLLSHTLTVAKTILALLHNPLFTYIVNQDDALYVALTHDFCKIGIYQPYQHWVKDANDQWQLVPGYRKVDSEVPFGHGESTMYILQKFKPLKIEQALALRWHMGAWRVTDSDMNDLQHANEKYPLVHLLQFADQLSITDYVTRVTEPFISV